MSYFITLSGSPTKFSKSGFLLRSVESILKERAIEFRVIHALDLPPSDPANLRIASQFIADTVEQIQQAAAIVLVTPATKESSPTLLASLLDLLPNSTFSKKPVLLFATGGLPGQVAILERALRQILFRLGTITIAGRVHVGTGSWITVGDDRPRLSRGAGREVAHAIDLILGAINPKNAKAVSLELAR
ncbi:MAG: NAD(P)H-dependent oxidoreductase [Verrucomicrobia bacterium]|nr:NAD(P)H-dependent oxidoreductase [Verrucomicrobiota bacterium]